MRKKILMSVLFVVVMTVMLISIDYLFSIYNGNFYFKLGKKNILPPLAFAIVVSLIRKKGWRNFAIITLFFFSMMEIWYFQYFGNYLPSIAFVQLFNNVAEVTESFFPYLPSLIIPMVICFLTCAVTVKIGNYCHKELLNFRYSSGIIILGLITNLIITYSYINNSKGKLRHWQARTIYPNKKEHSLYNFNKSVNYLLVGILPRKILGSTLSFPVLQKPAKVESIDNNIVLVIGESLRYDRMSLFGYDKKTTPLLDSLESKNKIKHRVIYTGGTMTKTAVGTLLNRLKYPGTEQIVEKKNNLFYLAKANDYKTHFISAQTAESMRLLENIMGKEKIDNYSNRDLFQEDIKDVTGKDEDILALLKKIDLNEKNLIVLQQRGSHSPYKSYTEKYSLFKDDYDNTVLYTDAFLTTIYNYLEQFSKKETHFIFVSDHGELLGENGKRGHGWFEPEVCKIPMITASLNSNRKIDIDDLRSQFDVSNCISKLMGYQLPQNSDEKDEIYINGSDLEGLAGYLKYTFVDDSLVSRVIVR